MWASILTHTSIYVNNIRRLRFDMSARYCRKFLWTKHLLLRYRSRQDIDMWVYLYQLRTTQYGTNLISHIMYMIFLMFMFRYRIMVKNLIPNPTYSKVGLCSFSRPISEIPISESDRYCPLEILYRVPFYALNNIQSWFWSMEKGDREARV